VKRSSVLLLPGVETANHAHRNECPPANNVTFVDTGAGAVATGAGVASKIMPSTSLRECGLTVRFKKLKLAAVGAENVPCRTAPERNPKVSACVLTTRTITVSKLTSPPF
jgi:hypothetical protein